MVDPRMAQATAVHTKIATIAIIRFNMVGWCLDSLRRNPNLPRRVGVVKYFSMQSEGARTNCVRLRFLAHNDNSCARRTWAAYGLPSARFALLAARDS